MRTMKIMKRMMSLAAAILALSACSESDDILSSFHNDPNAVHITAEVGKASADGFTRSNPLGATEKDQQKFNKDDEISVKADGQEAVTYKFNGSEWIPQDSKFLKWESDEMNFTAYYPASYNGRTITQPTEYTDEKSLAAADFMSYTGKQSNTNGNTLTLTMQRKMARVVVEVVGFNDQYAGATIDNINSLSICGVKAYKHNDNKFYALIKPCSNQADQEFLSLKVGEGNTETYTGIPALEAGKSYTYQLTVGKNKVVVTGITVADWTEGETINGKADSYPYVTFAAEAEKKFKMTTTGNYDLSDKFQYSVNEGKWENVVKDKEVTFGGTNGNLRLRGTNKNGTAINSDNYSTITFTDDNVKVACTGDIRTLLDYKNYKTVATDQAKFCYLFSNCSVLTSAPQLPATTLASECYSYMFSGCTNLKSAPALPAKTLAYSCYSYMFNNCTSIESAPTLPATTLAVYCYNSMFNNCKNLKSAPELSAKELASYCYLGMFYKCTSLESAPKLPATTLKEKCYRMMFYGCSKLSTVTMLAPSDQISGARFTDWLTNAGTKEGISRTLIVKDVDAYYALVDKGYLPDKWKKGNCNVLDGTPYVTFSANAAQTFKLKKENYFPSNIEYSVGTGDWKPLVENEQIPFGGDLGNLQLRGTENLQGTASDFSKYSQIIFGNSTKVACTGDIRTLLDYRDFKNVNTSNAKFCMLFMDCKVLTSAPDLPATQLANKCYYYMFVFCTSLTKAPELPAETLASGCYKGMFDGCAKLQEAPELSATKLANSCYQEMFYNCTSLKSAPNLPATTLAPYCYYDMFNSCKNLTSVTMLAPSDQITSTEKCCYGWLTDAGTKEGISRKLIVKNEDAYKALVNKGCLPADYWQKGKCTVN